VKNDGGVGHDLIQLKVLQLAGFTLPTIHTFYDINI